MNDLIPAILELAKAQNRIADQIGRLADALTVSPVEIPADWKPTFADVIQTELSSIGAELHEIATSLPSEPDDRN